MGFRPDRVGDQIRQELSGLLSRGAVHDPGIGFITLTRVKVSPDLQQARVYYTSLGDDAARVQTAKAL
ncbi:MAG: ribosome-binding factor A, partial [Vicinamibacterales bacterium]